MASPTADSIPNLASNTTRDLMVSLNDAASSYLAAKSDEAKTAALAKLNTAADQAILARDGMSLMLRRTMRDSMYEMVAAWHRRGRYRPEVAAVLVRVHNYYKV